jgi:hypothetical protein
LGRIWRTLRDSRVRPPLSEPESGLRHDFYLRATVSDYPTSELLPFPFETYRAHFSKNKSRGDGE